MARILLVDDHDEVRRAMKRGLELMGHAVTPAGDGREAVAVLTGTPMDLVVTDINMPDMDGIELIMEMKRRWPDVPVIAVSGGGMLPKELLLANASILGAVTTLQKPVDLGDLEVAVNAALGLGEGGGGPGGA